MTPKPSVKDRKSKSATVNLVIDFVEHQLTIIFNNPDVLHIYTKPFTRPFIHFFNINKSQNALLSQYG